ncbi:DUF4011 domain-containing protein [Phycisphaerales bacterium AB-hyl4]|uniref:DUF4011 domain-containing protein n=1 Tax=Natronomicrosphaera hydrolytica TaxID=3242702 RepID=A0ABV4UB24_9BACT
MPGPPETEQGVNTLFLACGLLEYYESPNSDTKFSAPPVPGAGATDTGTHRRHLTIADPRRGGDGEPGQEHDDTSIVSNESPLPAFSVPREGVESYSCRFSAQSQARADL